MISCAAFLRLIVILKYRDRRAGRRETEDHLGQGAHPLDFGIPGSLHQVLQLESLPNEVHEVEVEVELLLEVVDEDCCDGSLNVASGRPALQRRCLGEGKRCSATQTPRRHNSFFDVGLFDRSRILGRLFSSYGEARITDFARVSSLLRGEVEELWLRRGRCGWCVCAVVVVGVRSSRKLMR